MLLFRSLNPLISELKDLAQENLNQKQSKKQVIVNVQYDTSDLDACTLNPKNIGYFILEGLYNKLGIYDVVRKHKSSSKIGYDLNGLIKLLVFGRVINPKSKLATFESKNDYLFGITKSGNSAEIYRTLDALNAMVQPMQKRMNLKITQLIGRNIDVCFYDVTNYYFEIHQNDEDIIDEQGNILKEGLRKTGVSKENRAQPIVQMGLFMDDNGLPISYELFSGNKIEQTKLRPAMDKSIHKMDFGRVIVVADGGLNSDKNIAHLVKSKNGYIVSKSVRKSTKEVKKWILAEDDYVWNKDETFKIKSKITGQS